MRGVGATNSYQVDEEWGGEDSNLRRHSRQIYSLVPLATWEPPREDQFCLRPGVGRQTNTLEAREASRGALSPADPLINRVQ